MAAAYQLTRNDIVIRVADGAQIPNDPMNADRQAYASWISSGGVADRYIPPEPQPRTVSAQELMAQFTSDDAAKIQAAIGGDVSMWLLWYSMTAQKDPMVVTNDRFQQGWSALVQVLGQERMGSIASALDITV